MLHEESWSTRTYAQLIAVSAHLSKNLKSPTSCLSHMHTCTCECIHKYFRAKHYSQIPCTCMCTQKHIPAKHCSQVPQCKAIIQSGEYLQPVASMKPVASIIWLSVSISRQPDFFLKKDDFTTASVLGTPPHTKPAFSKSMAMSSLGSTKK